MNIEINKSLRELNTLGFDQAAERYVEVSNPEQLLEASEYAKKKGWHITVVGIGSNLVLTQDIQGLVIRIIDDRVRYKTVDASNSLVIVGAGKIWHELVLESLDRELPGLENLSLIPGTTGAAPVQNIGAYGVELKDVLVEVTALHLPTNTWRQLSAADCKFDYRDSLFKRSRGEYAISDITLKLGTCNPINVSYSGLSKELEGSDEEPSAKTVSDTVCAIRRAKLPDPQVIGNAGSFFKNPVVTQIELDNILKTYPQAVHYPIGNSQHKLAAGWMIDKLGYRGYRKGNVGVHDRQALVLTNLGNGTGASLIELAAEISRSVFVEFGVQLEIEPVVI